MNKRGQVTIFIIIAVLIVALVAVFFIFRDKLSVGGEKSNFETSSINTKVVSCLESTADDGINYIGLRGGYYDIPLSNSRFYFGDEMSYYYLNSKEDMPSMERIKRELENYIEFYLEDCVNLSGFEEQGYEIREGNVSVSVEVNNNKINLELIYPLVIAKGESTYRLTEFSSEIDSNLERLYLASEELVNSYSANPGLVCMSCLEDISNKYNVQIKAMPLLDSTFNESDAILFLVIDTESELNWRFVVEQ